MDSTRTRLLALAATAALGVGLPACGTSDDAQQIRDDAQKLHKTTPRRRAISCARRPRTSRRTCSRARTRRRRPRRSAQEGQRSPRTFRKGRADRKGRPRAGARLQGLRGQAGPRRGQLACAREARRRVICSVSLPVNVFCWLGWKEPSSTGPRRPTPVLRAVAEARPAAAAPSRRQAASQAKAPRHTITARVAAASSSSRGVGQAVVALAGQRLVGRRRAAHGRATTRRRRGAGRRRGDATVGWLAKPVRCMRGEQPVARAVAGEHAAGAVGAVGGGRQAEHVHARVRVAEARHRPAPVVSSANAARFSRATCSRHSTSRGQRAAGRRAALERVQSLQAFSLDRW